MSEQSEVTTPLIASLNQIPGVIAWRMHSGTVRMGGRFIHLGAEGQPDIGASVKGHAVFFECKTKDGRIRPAQMAWMDRATSAGAVYFVVRSVREAMDHVRELLQP